MYDIDELERRWIRYRRKRYALHAAIGAGIVLLTAVPILYVSFKPQPLSSEQESAESSQALAVRGNTTAEGNGSKVSAVASSERTLSAQVPSMEQKPKPRKPKIKISITDTPISDENDAQSSEKKRIELEMSDRGSRSVIREIEERFPTTRDYEDAMYLAKYYYGRKQYAKAEHWATQANTIDSGKEESWIIFGKAKARQGHRVEALKVLQAYYDRTGSERTKELIDRIRKGKKY